MSRALAPPSSSPAAGGGRDLARAAFPAVLVALGGWGLVLALHGRGGDLLIYLQAARRFSGGEPLYPLADGAMPFKYAPPSALFFLPLAWLPPALAAGAWNLLLVGLLGASAAALVRLAREAGGEVSPGCLALAVVVLLHSFFLELFYGQVDLPMLALLAWASWWAESGRPVRAGAAWACAALLKPTAALFAVVFLLRRRWAVLWLGPGIGLLLWLPLLLRYGLEGAAGQIAAWMETVSRTTAPWMLEPNSQGLPTLLLQVASRAPVGGQAAVVAQLAALALCALALFAVRRSAVHLFAAGAFCVAFSSALAWRANFVLAFPMAALALSERDPRIRLAARAAGALVAVAQGLAAAVGSERAQAVLGWRPFSVAFLALLAVALWSGRRSGAEGEDQVIRYPAA